MPNKELPILDTSNTKLHKGWNWRAFLTGEGGVAISQFETTGEHDSYIFQQWRRERNAQIEQAIKLLHDPMIDETHTLQEALTLLRETVKPHELVRPEPSIKGISKLQALIYSMRDVVPPPDSPLWQGINPEPGRVQVADAEDIAAYAPQIGDGQSKLPPKHKRMKGDDHITLADGSVVVADDDAESKAALAFVKGFFSGDSAAETSPELLRFDCMLDKIRDINDELRDHACFHASQMCEYARDFAEYVAIENDLEAQEVFIRRFDQSPLSAATESLN